MTTSTTELDLIAIGNALVDVIEEKDDAYITSQGMEKGGMALIDGERALNLYDDMTNPTQMAGGSAGNTIACFASFGGKAGYIGKVRNDLLGQSFATSLQETGVAYETPMLEGGDHHTGRCMIMVTPDGERTMNTYLGAANQLSPDDIDPEFITKAQIIYLEGYLFDEPHAKEAFYKAAREASHAGRQVALTLSDSFCVERHREEFKDLIENHVDILFANEAELKSLYETDDIEAAFKAVSKDCKISATTLGSKGSMIIKDGARTEVDVSPIDELVDTTGAGDSFAAGFLYGLTQNMNMAACGRLGAIAASEIIQQIGPRPDRPLSELIPADFK